MNESVSMRELELETAELLPSRETLNKWCGPTRGWGSSYSSTNTVVQQGNGNVNGPGITIANGALSNNNVSLFGLGVTQF